MILALHLNNALTSFGMHIAFDHLALMKINDRTSGLRQSRVHGSATETPTWHTYPDDRPRVAPARVAIAMCDVQISGFA
jgi:hypothetical protein